MVAYPQRPSGDTPYSSERQPIWTHIPATRLLRAITCNTVVYRKSSFDFWLFVTLRRKTVHELHLRLTYQLRSRQLSPNVCYIGVTAQHEKWPLFLMITGINLVTKVAPSHQQKQASYLRKT
ncbi:uncharacterized protein LOC127749101 [Frankliniella occidentalis]|uniref:Uncharacterized protein LOC127749101 n=1 Tax=Frankliniella occidentalis TaxID=133901 RepID=A0A9C6WWP0_FRAOC|nr:uncharacterized protein LOC127749101 [Frankliniella occidentalis]